jgi:hypothetical protein
MANHNFLITNSWQNRLIAMEPTQAALTAGVPRQKVAYTYDGQSRRIQRQTYTWDPAQNNNQGGCKSNGNQMGTGR